MSRPSAIDIMQEAVTADYPTVADVLARRYTPPADEVVLIIRRPPDHVLQAVGPYPTPSVDWTRLDPKDRIYPG